MNHIGKKYNKLTILALVNARKKHTICLCLCECGTKKEIRISSVIRGTTKSCGCLKRGLKDIAYCKNRKSKEYNVWCSIRTWCYTKSSAAYKHYGGKGIVVCERWRKFETFLADVGVAPDNNHIFSRIDKNKDFEPLNVQWIHKSLKQNYIPPTLNEIIIGVKYGMLTAIGESLSRKHHYIFKCDCGTTKEIYKGSIKDGQKSCGCMTKKYNVWPGMKIGKLTIIKIHDKKSFECLCDCGNTKIINCSSLNRKVPSKSCGCIKATRGGYSTYSKKEYQHQYNLEHYQKNKEKRKAASKKWRLNNIQRCKDMSAKHRATEKHRIYRRNYFANRRASDVQFKMAASLRNRLSSAIKNRNKAGSAVKDLGCSIEEFIKYIEEKFYHEPNTGEVMSWENRGRYGWHLDHIIPLASFDLTDREQFLKACHYTNYQPLWWWQNLSKGDKT